jgi:hypothetical protein
LDSCRRRGWTRQLSSILGADGPDPECPDFLWTAGARCRGRWESAEWMEQLIWILPKVGLTRVGNVISGVFILYPNWDFWFENKPSGNPARCEI